MHQEIIDYIGQAQKHGLTDFEIKQNLLSAGWEASSVEESFVFAKAAESKPQAVGSAVSPIRSPQNFSTDSPSAVKLEGKPAGITNPNANITITEKHFNTNTTTGFKKSTIIILAILLILSIGGVAFGYYQYVYTTPEKVMAKFFAGYLSSKTQPVKSNVVISYSDKNASGEALAPQEFTLGLNTDGYFDNRDANNTKADANVKLSFKYGGQEGSMQLQYMNFAKVYFINLANIPQLKGMFGDKDVSWIKFDLAELEKYAKEQSPENASSTEKLLNNDELTNKFNDLWNNAKILTPGKVLAKEDLNGVAVYRLEPEVDYVKLEKAVMDSADLIQKYQENSGWKLTGEQKTVLSAIIKKFKVKELKLWIGQKDYRLYKATVVIATPSLNDFSNSSVTEYLPGIASGRAKSRDALRLATARGMASALELYKNDFGGFPNGKDGKPVGIDPEYLNSLPNAPTPSDEACTDYFNTYWYSPIGNPSTVEGSLVYPDYEFSFCLGESTDGIPSGIAKMTSAGIKGGIECPTTDPNCQKQTTILNDQTTEELSKMTFNAETSFEATFNDYGVVNDIKEPENALNLLDMIKGFFSDFSTPPSLD